MRVRAYFFGLEKNRRRSSGLMERRLDGVGWRRRDVCYYKRAGLRLRRVCWPASLALGAGRGLRGTGRSDRASDQMSLLGLPLAWTGHRRVLLGAAVGRTGMGRAPSIIRAKMCVTDFEVARATRLRLRHTLGSHGPTAPFHGEEFHSIVSSFVQCRPFAYVCRERE